MQMSKPYCGPGIRRIQSMMSSAFATTTSPPISTVAIPSSIARSSSTPSPTSERLSPRHPRWGQGAEGHGCVVVHDDERPIVEGEGAAAVVPDDGDLSEREPGGATADLMDLEADGLARVGDEDFRTVARLYVPEG